MSLTINVPKISVTPEADDEDEVQGCGNQAEALTDVEDLFDNLPTADVSENFKTTNLNVELEDQDNFYTDLEDFETDNEEDKKDEIYEYPLDLPEVNDETGLLDECVKLELQNSNSAKTTNLCVLTKTGPGSSLNDKDIDMYNTDIESYITDEDLENNINFNEYVPRKSVDILSESAVISDKSNLSCANQTNKESSHNLQVILKDYNASNVTDIENISSDSNDESCSKKIKPKRKKKNTKFCCSDVEDLEFSDDNENIRQYIDKSHSKSSKQRLASTLSEAHLFESDNEDEKVLPFPLCKTVVQKASLKIPKFDETALTDVEEFEDFDLPLQNDKPDIEIDENVFQSSENDCRMSEKYRSSNKSKYNIGHVKPVYNANQVVTDSDEMNTDNEIDKEMTEVNKVKSNVDFQLLKVRKNKKTKLIKKVHRQSTLTMGEPCLELTDTEDIDSDKDDEDYMITCLNGHLTDIEDMESFSDIEDINNINKSIEDLELPKPTRNLVLLNEESNQTPLIKIMPLNNDYEESLKYKQEDGILTDEEIFNEKFEDASKLNSRCTSPDIIFFEDGIVASKDSVILNYNEKNAQNNGSSDSEEIVVEKTKRRKPPTFKYIMSKSKRTLLNEEPVNSGLTDVEELYFNEQYQNNYASISTSNTSNGKQNNEDDDQNILYLKGGGYPTKLLIRNIEEILIGYTTEWDGSNNQIKLKMKEQETIEKGLCDNPLQECQLKNIAVIRNPNYSMAKKQHHSSTTHKSVSYPEIDDMLKKLTIDVERQENLLELHSDNLKPHTYKYNNNLELLPSTNALFEIPIKKKIRIPKRYQSTKEISVNSSEDYPQLNQGDNRAQSIDWSYILDSTQHDLEINKICRYEICMNTSNSLNEDQKDNCENIAKNSKEQLTESNRICDNETNIWWEGTYRGANPVPDEKLMSTNSLQDLGSYKSFTFSSEDLKKSDFNLDLFSLPTISAKNIDKHKKIVKADVKLKIKSTSNNHRPILVKSARDFKVNNEIRKCNSESSLSNKVPSYKLSKKIFNFKQKMSDILNINKSKYQYELKSNIEGRDNKESGDLVFTLPTLFIKHAENEIKRKDHLNNVMIKRTELIAATNNRFPLEDSTATIDYESKTTLNSNKYFSPSYNEYVSFLPQKLLYQKSNSLPNAYCDWITTSEDLSSGDKEHPSSGLTDSSFELTPAATKCLPEPQPRVVESPDTQLEFSKVVETSITDKQISPVRDDLLDNKTDEILLESYSDKKHFWENVSKESSTKPINLQDSSINSKIPIPKPRGTVQHSTSSEESENYFKVSLSTDKSIEYSESTPVDNRQISEEHSITPEEKILSEYQASFIPPQAVKRTHHKYDKHDFEKGDSLDSDRAQKGSSQLIENTSYISDSEDVEHYISDSEIEDRVPQIRERQMSVFAPTPIISKCAYARSASLPTEDLYEVSARSNKLRKQYYEEQIKKEMIEEQLISELEDNQSPERKILCSTDEISDNETNRTSLSMDGIENKIDNKSVLNSITTEDSYLSESIPTDNIDTIDDTRVTTNKDLQIEEKSLSRDLEEKDIINEQKQIIGIYSQGNLNSQDDLLLTHNVIKEAQSLEVHVDKSEIEDSEKITDLVGTSIIDPKDVVPVNVNKLEIADVILTETNSSSKQEISSINVPKQHVEKTIWEVPIQCNLQFNEVVTDILDDKICLVDSGSHVIESNQSKREEEFTHEKGKPENYNDIEKIILDSLYHQKVDPDEAKKIANSLIHEIESEISKSESVSTSKIPKTPTTVPSVSDYLSHLAETKGLDQREVELVKSVLARRQRELSKLSRDDTLASSMEITDEDLKYSGTELDYSHLLEQQIDQLEAEKIDTNLYDDSVTQQQDSTPITCVGEQKKLVEKSDVVLESSENLKLDKDTIFEEDETVTETNTDDSQSHQSKQPLNNSENIVSDAEKSVKYITQQNKEDIISFGNSNEIEHTTAQQNEEDITSFESPKEIGYTTTLQDKEDMIESSKEIKHTTTTSYSETTSTITNTFSNIITENKQSPEVKPVLLSPSEEPRAIVEEHAILRKLKSDPDSSSSGSNAKQEQKLECEAYSSSGESHYQSFEIDSGKSRPCSSDVEGLIATGSSEYESALASQIHSGKSYPTSTEYQTAISSISSKESMKSLDSESSGNLASIEVSEMSETLIPSTSDLDGDILDLHEQQIVDDDTAQLNWKHHVAQSSEISDSEILSYGGPSIDLSEDELELRQNEIQSKMKRSYEMTFQPEPKLLLHDSPQGDTVENDEKLASSLDEGSILSISVSSASSNAANRTVIEVLPKDLDEITSIDISTSTPPDANINIDSVTLTTSTIEEDGIQSVSTQVTTQSAVENKDIETPLIKEESRRKGHKRQDSYVINFSPKQSNIVDPETSNINLSLKEGKSDEKKDIDESEKHDFWDSEEIKTDQKSDREMDENSIQNTSEHENSSLVLRSHDFYLECKRSSKDISNQKQPLEKRDSHGKSSSTSSEKSSFDEAEAEAAFNMVAHISPAHKIKQICPILEDEDAEKCEEPKRIVQKDTDLKKNDQSPVFIPDIKVTEHMTPLVDKNFRYPDLELETKEKELEMQKSTPQTPASVSSKSSEETDQGREYVVENNTIILEESQVDKIISDSQSETATVVDSSSKNDDLDRKTDSPNSDSFEMLEKPDLIDDFVVIEEVAKEANEFDSEGKSVQIQQTVNKKKSKHDHEVEEYLVKSAPTPLTKMTDVKYYPDGSSGDELGFDFEDSPPTNGKNATSSKSTSKQYIQEFDRELEANKKWIEQQFQGNSAAVATAGYGYEMEFERGPLEDIKEEDITDFEGSSRIGSLGSQKESGGSLGSVKDSYSSTPEYDVLAGRKYFTRSGDHDDISMSSLQEFENLEQAMSLEMRKYHCSQDSSSNGSFKTRHHKGQGDDISVSSLKEFEGLEKACIAAHKIEIKVKEEEDMLAQIDECPESIASDSCETQKQVTQSDDDDYEKRLFEIDEIIRQAQTNVERFIDLKEVEKTESLGRGDSVEEVSKIPDLDLDAPLVKSTVKVQWKEGDDVLVTSTDSLDLKPSISIHGSTDSLDQKTGGDIMTTSTDSIEVNSPKSKNDNIMTDSIELKNDEKTGIISSDSLELGAYVATTSVDEDGSRVYDHDISISSTSKDCSTGEEFRTEGIINIKYSDQSVTSSSATHATYQYETDSVFSGSFTSEGSNTMVSSMETFDPMTTKEFAAVVEQESSYTKLTSSEDSMSQYTFYEDEANISVTNIFNKKTISVVPDDDTSNPTYSEQSATTCETTGEQDKSAKEKEDKSNLQDDYKEFMDRRASDHVPGEFEH